MNEELIDQVTNNIHEYTPIFEFSYFSPPFFSYFAKQIPIWSLLEQLTINKARVGNTNEVARLLAGGANINYQHMVKTQLSQLEKKKKKKHLNFNFFNILFAYILL